MQLPDEIHLLVKCNEPVDLSGLVFVMKVSAGTKNSYTIIFPKTNERGAAILSAEDFRGQFEDHHHFALMDYNGSVEAANSTVEFDLLNLKRLRESEVLDWPLMPHAERMWKTPKKEI